MTGSGVGSRCFVDRQSVVNVVPIVGCYVGGIDVERLDSIDQLQDPFDFGQLDSRDRLSPPGVIQGTVE